MYWQHGGVRARQAPEQIVGESGAVPGYSVLLLLAIGGLVAVSR